MSDASIIRQQRERIDELEETIRQMRAADRSMQISFPLEWRLTRVQAAILGTLNRSAGGRATHEQISDAVAQARIGWEGNERSKNNTSVQIWKLRQALKPYGIVVVTLWGQGYALTPASRQIIRGALREQVAA